MISGTTILNTAVSVLLIKLGIGIHGVKLGSTIVFCISPILTNVIARNHYKIDKSVEPDFSSINQRWDAMFHQVAGFIYSNTDIMLITLFCGLKEVSVYTIYCLVSNGLKKIMTTFTNGVEAAFGDMLVRDDKKLLYQNVRIYEVLLNGVVCILYGTSLVLIIPFIKVYTRGINDVNYIRYSFAYLLIVTEAVHVLRQPYHSLVEAAGHYKQTKHIAIVQAALNLGTSIILVNMYGLVGVMVGTLVSDIYRGVAYRFYVRKHMLSEITITYYLKRMLVTIISFGAICLVPIIIPYPNLESYRDWILYSFPVTLFAIVICLVTSFCFYRNETIELHKKMKGIIRSILPH